MELSWSTFILEIINFLVLVWLLKRFLYKPVMNIIAQRHASVEAQLNEAKTLNQQAEQLKQQYESRLEDWEKEKQRQRDQFQQQLDQEKTAQEKAFRAKLTQEQEKSKVIMRRQQEQQQKAIEAQALQQAAEFSTRLLSLSASQELEARIVDILVKDLNLLPEQTITSLQQQWGSPANTVMVHSAYMLSRQQQQDIQAALSRIFGTDMPVEYQLDNDLLAGLAISSGPWKLAFNLRDELKSFAEFSHVNK